MGWGSCWAGGWCGLRVGSAMREIHRKSIRFRAQAHVWYALVAILFVVLAKEEFAAMKLGSDSHGTTLSAKQIEQVG